MLRQAGPAVTVRLCAHAPGLEPQPEQGSIQARTAGITASVLQRSDAVLFVLDARSGVLPGDHTLAAWLRAHNPARVLLVGNKAEGRGAAGALGASRLLPAVRGALPAALTARRAQTTLRPRRRAWAWACPRSSPPRPVRRRAGPAPSLPKPQ